MLQCKEKIMIDYHKTIQSKFWSFCLHYHILTAFHLTHNILWLLTYDPLRHKQGHVLTIQMWHIYRPVVLGCIYRYNWESCHHEGIGRSRILAYHSGTCFPILFLRHTLIFYKIELPQCYYPKSGDHKSATIFHSKISLECNCLLFLHRHLHNL